MLSVTQEKSKKDTYPPSKILDLRVRVNATAGIVSLKWSAPGDDYDWGKASSYEVIIADSWEEARKMIGARIHDLPSPLSAFNEQSLHLDSQSLHNHSLYDRLHYVAIVAIDAAGNKGVVGNVAAFFIRHPPSTSTLPPMVYSTGRMPSFSTEIRARDMIQKPPARLSLDNIIMITVFLSGVLLLVILLIVYASFCRVREYESTKKNSESIVQNHNIMIRTNSSMEIDQVNSLDDTDTVVTDSERLKIVSPNSNILPEHQKGFPLPYGPTVEDPNVVGFSNTIQDPFPDVTQTGCYLYPVPQPSSAIQPNPHNHQIPCPENQLQYPYQCNQVFTQQLLPPYSPGFPQFSQPSNFPRASNFPQTSQREEIYYCESPQFRNNMPSCVSDNYKILAPTMIYSNQYVENMSLPPIPSVTTSKVTPTAVSSNPQDSNAPANNNSLIFVADPTNTVNSETNRRNVTPV